MKRRERSAPIWLFSFVDLAFLLLIALTQLTADPVKTGVEVAELALPRIATLEPSAGAGAGAPRWQLRVHPLPPPVPVAGAREGADARASSEALHAARTPFELIAPDSLEPAANTADAAASPIGADELAARLGVLRDRDQARPLLAPHRDARSEDLLTAVAILERVYAADRGVVVEKVPAVSARSEPTPAASASERAAR